MTHMLRAMVLGRGAQGREGQSMPLTDGRHLRTNIHLRRQCMLRTGIATVQKFVTVALLSVPGFALGATAVGSLTSPVALNTGGWSFGSQAGGSVAISTNTSLNYNGDSGSVMGSYPAASGNVYAWGDFSVASLNTEDIYIDFWAKMPAAKQGLKFLKIFGGTQGTGYANTTFALDYT